MSEMVERVARAIFMASVYHGYNDETLRAEWARMAGIHRATARAAIEAMREPTEAMVDSCGNGEAAKWARGTWVSYIDAALPAPSSSVNGGLE